MNNSVTNAFPEHVDIFPVHRSIFSSKNVFQCANVGFQYTTRVDVLKTNMRTLCSGNNLA